MVTDSYLALLHSLEQGTLHLGRGSVDFVGKYEVGEYRAFLDLEGLVFHRIYHCTDYVGRQKVGGKLYTAVFCIYQLCKSLDRKGFGKTGHAFEKHVAIGKHRNKQALYKVFLTNDSPVHATGYKIDKIALARDQFIEFSDIYAFAHNS